jgi:hypothetical protein
MEKGRRILIICLMRCTVRRNILHASWARGSVLMNIIGRTTGDSRCSDKELFIHLYIWSKTQENQGNLCPDGRAQDLPDIHRFLASSPKFRGYRDVSWVPLQWFCFLLRPTHDTPAHNTTLISYINFGIDKERTPLVAGFIYFEIYFLISSK